MAIQLSEAVRDAMNDAIETTLGTDAHLIIYDLDAGAPAACSDAITATKLATLVLPSDYFSASSGGVMALTGTWTNASTTDGTGTADFFRLLDSGETACGLQGTAGMSSDTPDLVLDNSSIATGQTVTITTFSLTAGSS